MIGRILNYINNKRKNRDEKIISEAQYYMDKYICEKFSIDVDNKIIYCTDDIELELINKLNNAIRNNPIFHGYTLKLWDDVFELYY